MANFPNAAFPTGRVDGRSVFITRTYTHLVGGILGFILVELGLFESGLAGPIVRFVLGFNWILILGAFMLVGWLAFRAGEGWTRNAQLFVATGVLGGYIQLL